MNRRAPWPICASLLLSCATLIGANLHAADQTAACPESERLFVAHCGMCHLPGGIGTLALAERPGSTGGLLWERIALSPLYVETVVRTGVHGMPRVTRAELSNEDAKRIALYVTACRRAEGKPKDKPGQVHE